MSLCTIPFLPQKVILPFYCRHKISYRKKLYLAYQTGKHYVLSNVIAKISKQKARIEIQ